MPPNYPGYSYGNGENSILKMFKNYPRYSDGNKGKTTSNKGRSRMFFVSRLIITPAYICSYWAIIQNLDSFVLYVTKATSKKIYCAIFASPLLVLSKLIIIKLLLWKINDAVLKIIQYSYKIQFCHEEILIRMLINQKLLTL